MRSGIRPLYIHVNNVKACMRIRKTMGKGKSYLFGIKTRIKRNFMFIKTIQWKKFIDLSCYVMGRMPKTIMPQITVIDRLNTISTRALL